MTESREKVSAMCFATALDEEKNLHYHKRGRGGLLDFTLTTTQTSPLFNMILTILNKFHYVCIPHTNLPS